MEFPVKTCWIDRKFDDLEKGGAEPNCLREFFVRATDSSLPGGIVQFHGQFRPEYNQPSVGARMVARVYVRNLSGKDVVIPASEIPTKQLRAIVREAC